MPAFTTVWVSNGKMVREYTLKKGMDRAIFWVKARYCLRVLQKATKKFWPIFEATIS